MPLALVAAALLGFVGHPTPQLIAPVRRLPPASVSSGTFRLPVARTPAVTAKVGGYASEPEDPIAPAPLVLDATTKKQLAILVSTSFLVQLGVGMGIIVLPVFAQSIGLGQLGVGLLVALPQVTKLLCNLPVGYLVDVVGRRPPLVLGAIVDALGQIMTAAAGTMSQLVPARLIVGVGSATGGSTGAAATAYQMDVLAKYPEHSGRLLGVIQALGFLAFAVGPAIGGAIAQRGGPALPFYLLGAALLLSAPLKAMLPETLPESSRRSLGLDSMRSGLGAAASASAASYRKLLRDPNQLGLLALKISFLSGLSLVLTVVPLHAAAAWGATAAEMGQLYSFVTLLSLPLSILSGGLADRVGRARLAVCGSLATALGVACTPFATTQRAYYAVRSLWAAGEAVLITAYAALALDLTPEAQRGARASLDNQVGDLALGVLPLLLAVVGGRFSHQAALWLGAAIMLACNGFFAKVVMAKPS